MSSEKLANDIQIENIGKKYFSEYSLEEKKGLSFVFYCMSSLLIKKDKEILESITEACFNKKNDDLGIDGLNFCSKTGTVNIFNCQYTDKQRRKEVGAMERGLRYIFIEDKKDIMKLSNKRLKEIIFKIRKKQNGFKKIKINYCTNSQLALDKKLGEKIDKEKKEYQEYFYKKFGKVFKNKYNNPEIIFNILDCKKVFFEKKRKDNPLYEKSVRMKCVVGFKESEFDNEIMGVKGVVVTVSGGEIGRIVKEYNDRINFKTGFKDCLFDENIRGYLGPKIEINNKKIKETTFTKGDKFWFLNNGITIISSHIQEWGSSKSLITLEFPQIVNGQQTAKCIAEASDNKKFSKNVKVICRLYETSDPVLINDITEASNTQTKIDKSDLISNNTEQRALEEIFLSQGYLYKRKRQHKYEKNGFKIKKSISKKDLARVGLCIFKNKPHEARLISINELFNKKDEVDNYYKIIFETDPYFLLAAYLIWWECKRISKETSFHLSSIIWSQIQKKLEKDKIDELLRNYKNIPNLFKNEFRIGKEIIKNIPKVYKKDKKIFNNFLNSENSKNYIFRKIANIL